MSEATSEPTLLMYAPYLPLRERIDVNGWAVVPANKLEEANSASDFARVAAAGLVSLYSRDDDAITGAFAYRESEGLGAGSIDGDDVLDMHRTLVMLVLDGNPSPIADDEQEGNQAYGAMTSDNALVWGHRVGGDGWVAAEYGAMIRTLSAGYNVLSDHGEPPLRIRPPADLWMPTFRPHLDGEFADAVHRVITADSDDARRVHRGIGWLDLAWRNAASITPDLRIPAVRSGFEVLLNADGVVSLRESLSALLDPDDAPRTHRVWLDRGNERQADLTELQWWFVCFGLLRNAIAHGDAVEADRYAFNGLAHLDLGVDWLRRAIKAKVIASGYPELELDSHARALRRALRKYGLAPPTDQVGSDPELPS